MSDLFCSTVCFKFEGQANGESRFTKKFDRGRDGKNEKFWLRYEQRIMVQGDTF